MLAPGFCSVQGNTRFIGVEVWVYNVFACSIDCDRGPKTENVLDSRGHVWGFQHKPHVCFSGRWVLSLQVEHVVLLAVARCVYVCESEVGGAAEPPARSKRSYNSSSCNSSSHTIRVPNMCPKIYTRIRITIIT